MVPGLGGRMNTRMRVEVVWRRPEWVWVQASVVETLLQLSEFPRPLKYCACAKSYFGHQVWHEHFVWRTIHGSLIQPGCLVTIQFDPHLKSALPVDY